MLSRTRIFRMKGMIFLALLEQVCQYSEALGEPELCLVTDNKCPAATAALRELGAELWNEEYMMEYNTAADSSEDGNPPPTPPCQTERRTERMAESRI